jgi:hypothetical protein
LWSLRTNDFGLEHGNLWLFMWSIAALLRKVFAFVFDVIDVAFEYKHVVVSSTASRRSRLYQFHGIIR